MDNSHITDLVQTFPYVDKKWIEPGFIARSNLPPTLDIESKNKLLKSVAIGGTRYKTNTQSTKLKTNCN